MRKHATDLTSLIAGLVFVAIGVSYLVAVATDARIEWRWVLPLGLIGLGLAGTINQARQHRTRDDDAESDFAEELQPPVPAPGPGPGPEDEI